MPRPCAVESHVGRYKDARHLRRCHGTRPWHLFRRLACLINSERDTPRTTRWLVPDRKISKLQILNEQLNSQRVRRVLHATFANTCGVTSFDPSKPEGLKQPWEPISERPRR